MADARPTAKQLRYLRQLAAASGTTFAWPRTRRQASRLIDELKQRERSSRVERAVERQDVVRDVQEDQPAYAVHDDEIVGFGGSAHWRGREGER